MQKLKMFVLSLVMAFISISVQAQTTKKSTDETIQVKTSSVCNMCKKSLEKAMAYEKGVKSSSLDVNSQVLTVVFDSRKTNADNIRKTVNATGYDADDKPADARAYNKLDDCCKKENGVH
ncbi:heavy-metal-associated domain-containing protein [Pontibacter arcticus]|uniref:MerP protein n=1 Tax=Pontibacter arcticus TaxID=2080288 RepID=A0A364RBN3_9BACT|nr:cation transporter [Pontibacter arcticus]RAU81657.1 MerP protein [Pontibacter arcticus]